MDKAERAKLLRDRMRAIRGPAIAPRPSPAKPKRASRPAYVRDFTYFAPGQNPRELPAKWVYLPVEGPDPLALKPRRVARKSPLWALEEQWADRPQMPKRRLATRTRLPCSEDA
jgi:hypothetical protein